MLVNAQVLQKQKAVQLGAVMLSDFSFEQEM